MNRYLANVQRQLTPKRILRPIILATSDLRGLAKQVAALFPTAVVARAEQTNLMGRDVLLLHGGEHGWDELLETICRQSPGRLFVVAPECPHSTAFKLRWIADLVLVDRETTSHDLLELSLSA